MYSVEKKEMPVFPVVLFHLQKLYNVNVDKI